MEHSIPSHSGRSQYTLLSEMYLWAPQSNSWEKVQDLRHWRTIPSGENLRGIYGGPLYTDSAIYDHKGMIETPFVINGVKAINTIGRKYHAIDDIGGNWLVDGIKSEKINHHVGDNLQQSEYPHQPEDMVDFRDHTYVHPHEGGTAHIAALSHDHIKTQSMDGKYRRHIPLNNIPQGVSPTKIFSQEPGTLTVLYEG